MLRELSTPDDPSFTGHLPLGSMATGKGRGTGELAAPAGFPGSTPWLLQEAKAPDVRNGSQSD